MNEEKHHRGSYWFGVILIIAGFLFLFQNFGLVSPEIWQEIVKFWPMLIVLLGLEIILGHSPLARFLMFIVTILLIFGILAVVGLIPVSGLLFLRG